MSGGSPTPPTRMVAGPSWSPTWWFSSWLVVLSTSWSCPWDSSPAPAMSRSGTWSPPLVESALLRHGSIGYSSAKSSSFPTHDKPRNLFKPYFPYPSQPPPSPCIIRKNVHSWAQVIGTASVVSYYCVLIALAIYYLVVSCQSVLPWTVCWPELAVSKIHSLELSFLIPHISLYVGTKYHLRGQQCQSHRYFLPFWKFGMCCSDGVCGGF